MKMVLTTVLFRLSEGFPKVLVVQANVKRVPGSLEGARGGGVSVKSVSLTVNKLREHAHINQGPVQAAVQ